MDKSLSKSGTGASAFVVSTFVLSAFVVSTLGCASAPLAPESPRTSNSSGLEHRVMGTPAAVDRSFLSPCSEPEDPDGGLCGIYEVFENRESQSGRKIGLRVVVVPATGGGPVEEAITYFEGGPGGASTPSTGFLAQLYEPVRENRDVFVVDLRGTGGSEELRCPYQDEAIGFSAPFMPTEGVEACWKQLSGERDLQFYRTDIAIDDVNEVRQALGYERLHLLGGSYGTRAAQIYLRRHPSSVATVQLAGPVPNDAAMPSTFAVDAQSAFDGWARECAEDAECAKAFPDPLQDLKTVLALVDAEPVEVEVEVRDPKTGEPTAINLQRSSVVQTIRYMDYQSGTALQVPLALRQAATGNWQPLADMATFYSAAILGGIAEGFYLSVTCAEDVPFFDQARAEEAAEGTYLGAYRVRQQKAACEKWPVPPVAASFHEPVRSSKPILIIVGERDPVTPPRWGEEVAKTLTGSRTLEVADGAHGFGGLENTDCVDQLGVELVRTGMVEGLDLASCQASIRRPEFPTRIVVDEVIEMSADQLAVFVGTYRIPDFGVVFEIRQTESVLTLSAPGLPTGELLPLADGGFRVQGMGPGISMRFEVDESGPTGGVLNLGALGGEATFERTSSTADSTQ